MARFYRTHRQEPKLFERWQVQREYFTVDGDLCLDGYPVVYETRAAAEAELEKIKADDKGCWGGWYNLGDTLYVSSVWCSEA